MKGKFKEDLIKILQDNIVSFAEQSHPMIGIKRHIIEHQLAINPKANLV